MTIYNNSMIYDHLDFPSVLVFYNSLMIPLCGTSSTIICISYILLFSAYLQSNSPQRQII